MPPVVAAILAPLLALALFAGPTSAPGPASTHGPASVPVPGQADEPRRFWVQDKGWYSSPWYVGDRRKMIGFGCTRAPYYDPDPRCTGGRGFHHGIDIAMPCGTRLFAGLRGRVVDPSSRGTLGSSYGTDAFRIRNHRYDVDIAIAHVRRVYVEPGDVVRRGQLVARASDAGAPDGCHLHFEVRPMGAGYREAVRPHPHLRLSRN